MTKQKLWELIEAYRTSGGREEHHARKERLDAVLDKLLEQPAQQEQTLPFESKWVGTVVDSGCGYKVIGFSPDTLALIPIGTKLYTSPPASKPLTDEQIEQCMKQAYATVQGRNLEHAFARAIEAAHGIIGEAK